MRVTVQGTLNVFRAAQAAGVKKVVFMSSGSTMCAYEWDDGSPYGMMARGEYDRVPADWPMIDETWPARPDSPYAVGKLFGEACGRYFSDRFGMSVLVIRLGAVLDTDRPKLRRHYPGYLSQRDAVDLIDRCLSAPLSLRYEVFDAISENRWRWRDTGRGQARCSAGSRQAAPKRSRWTTAPRDRGAPEGQPRELFASIRERWNGRTFPARVTIGGLRSITSVWARCQKLDMYRSRSPSRSSARNSAERSAASSITPTDGATRRTSRARPSGASCSTS